MIPQIIAMTSVTAKLTISLCNYHDFCVFDFSSSLIRVSRSDIVAEDMQFVLVWR